MKIFQFEFNPKEISECAKIAKNQFNYDGININVGCPSRKVENGRFGACLMNEPEVVGKCIKEIKKTTNIPIVAIGGIKLDNYEKLLLNKANFLAISSYIWSNKKYKPTEAIEKLK